MDPNLGKVIQIKKKKCFLRYLQDLEEKGYAIIPNVIEEELLEKHRQQMWEMLYTLTSKWEVPIEENNPKSYRGFYDFFPLHSMLLQHWEVGQSQLSWDIRQNPKVIQCFEKIFSTSELLVSYDGMSIHFPPEITGRGWWNKHWFHTDQNFYIPGRKAIQGQVNLYDVREGDATLVVLEKSHLFHSEISQNFDVDPKQNFLKLSEDQMNFYLQNGCTEKRIQCPAGSLVLWDSRTIHYGSEPLKERKMQNMRCAAPINIVLTLLKLLQILPNFINLYKELNSI